MKNNTLYLKITQSILLVAVVLFGFSLMYAQLLYINYRLIAYALVIVLVLLACLWFKRKAINIVLTVLLVLGSVGTIYAQSIINQIGEDKKNVDVIDFIVLKGSEVQTLSDTTFSQFQRTTLMSNQVVSETETHLKSVLSFVPSISVVSTYDSLVHNLYDKKTDVIILNRSSKERVLEEIDNSFESKTRVIDSVTIELDETDHSKPVADVTNTPYYVYISGNDNTGEILSSARSDVNMLLLIDPTTHQVMMVSIPRDTYTYSPCYGYKDKLTHTGNGTVECTIGAVNKMFDLEINYYLKLNFSSFIEIVDVIGEISVYANQDFTTTGGAYSFVEGYNTITSGEEALAFVRERYNLINGDVDRAMNQQEVLKGIINKIISPSSIFKINQIASQIASSIDTNFGSSNISKVVAQQQNGNPSWTFVSESLEGEYGSDYVSGFDDPKSVYYPNQESIDSIKAKMKEFLSYKKTDISE